jgi:hypothetical protein
MTFGIPADIHPIDDDGTMLLYKHIIVWIVQRIELEKMERNNQIAYILMPGPFDILLLGTGKAAAKRPGNIRYKLLIEGHRD